MKRSAAEGWGWWEERMQRSRRVLVGVMKNLYLDQGAEDTVYCSKTPSNYPFTYEFYCLKTNLNCKKDLRKVKYLEGMRKCLYLINTIQVLVIYSNVDIMYVNVYVYATQRDCQTTPWNKKGDYKKQTSMI